MLPSSDAGYPRKLSEFGFFSGLGVSTPSPALVGYSLRTPLFSDYAQKQRFIYVPGGAKIAADDAGVLEFPVGTALIKTFGYGEGAAFRPIETRVLLRRAAGWEALPYVWNADLTDADLKLAGTRLPVTVTKPSGERVAISYAVPNKNQCKECHARAGAGNADWPSGGEHGLCIAATGEALRSRIALGGRTDAKQWAGVERSGDGIAGRTGARLSDDQLRALSQPARIGEQLGLVPQPCKGSAMQSPPASTNAPSPRAGAAAGMISRSLRVSPRNRS